MYKLRAYMFDVSTFDRFAEEHFTQRQTIQTKFGFWVWVVWGVVSLETCIKRFARKLRIIILLHFGLVTFIILGDTRVLQLILETARFRYSPNSFPAIGVLAVLIRGLVVMGHSRAAK